MVSFKEIRTLAENLSGKGNILLENETVVEDVIDVYWIRSYAMIEDRLDSER